MHNLKTNFDKFLGITKMALDQRADADGNLSFYPRPPAMSDCQTIALALTAEALGIDSENHLWGKLSHDHAGDFPALPHRTNYSRRRKRLAGAIREVASGMASMLPGPGTATSSTRCPSLCAG